MKRVSAIDLPRAVITALFPAIFFFMVAFGYSSESCGMEIRNIPDVQYPDMLAEEEFLERTRFVELVPETDPHLAFRIRVPKNWESSEDIGLRNFIVSRKLVGELARYYSPPRLDQRSSVSVSAMEMEHKITAKNWFIHHVFSQGYSLEGMTAKSDDHIIAEYVLIEDDTPYRVRAAAIASGKRVVLAQYYVPLDNADQEKAMQAAIIDTFELTDPEDDVYFASDIYAFLDLVQFEYPLTWELRAPLIRDIERMEARLVNILGETQLNGQIDILVLSYDSPTLDLKQEVAQINDEFIKRSRFEFGPLIETIDDYEYDKSIDNAIVEVYSLESSRRIIGYEYWFALLNDEDYYAYIVTMITPARTADFYTWAQNIEIFEFLLRSIRPGNQPF